MTRDQFLRQLSNDLCISDDLREVHTLNMNVVHYALSQLPEEDQGRLKGVPVVLLPTRDINALCGMTETQEPFIILELGLPALLEVFNCIFLRGIMISNSTPEAITPEKAQILVDALAGLLSGDREQATTFRDRLHEHLRLENFPVYYRETLFKAQMSWFVGHEYGHIALGHLGTLRDLKLLGSSRDVGIWQRDMEEEFEADSYALRFATAWVDRGKLPQSVPQLEKIGHDPFFETVFQLAAPDICGSLLRLVEYAQQILDHFVASTLGEAISDNLGLQVRHFLKACRTSHPPARLRHERLRADGPCQEHHSVLTIAHNAEVVIQQIMIWIHEKKLSIEGIRKLVPDQLEAIPDDMLAGEALRLADWTE